MISIANSEKDDIVLNVEEASKIFGIGASAMYKKVKRKQVPHHYMGKRIYFLKNELIDAIRNS